MMKFSSKGLTAVVFLCVTVLSFGCSQALRGLKQESGQAPSASAKKAEAGKNSPGLPVPKFEPPPPPPPGDEFSPAPIDPVKRDEINKAALEFAKNFKSVVGVKTCYSKIYGGWSLYIYVQKKGKKPSFETYSWDDDAKEWAVSYHHSKGLDPAKLEEHIKQEVDDERCFILK